ncbi:tetratricopeptide repeat protein [Bowmanella dokdonensis]|uniref:Uncharacterized protein n=1 Tax=Bowmanella dokdonensis TaxID=751969 RepID=A0A939IRA7_9ALTE|nr:hypothetical protein [Bowmanella dokdonensis]MBN7825452.1 hypothetical protein [Bowmanella dokdonensis]
MSDSNLQTKSCVACHSAIPKQAGVCRYCHSKQHHSWSERLATQLKWVGGVVTVLSLVIGALTLSGIFRDWVAREQAVAELSDAAHWLIQAKDYRRAWQLYHRALLLSPNATTIRQKQQDLARLWAREFGIPVEEGNALSNDLIEALYQSISSQPASQQADSLAHIARLAQYRIYNQLIEHADIESLYRQALALDEKSTYANLFYAAWLLGQGGVTEEKLDQARNHFVLAVHQDPDDHFARELQLWWLHRATERSANGTQQKAFGYLILALEQAMQSGFQLTQELRTRILNEYSDRMHFTLLEGAITVLPPDQHLHLYNWLVAGEPRHHHWQRDFVWRDLYIRARLKEAAGQKAAASSDYQQLLENEAAYSSGALDKLVDQGLLRTTGQLPSRALARTYIDDPVDQNNPAAFHQQTLLHFNPKYLPDNLLQALEYYSLPENQTAPSSAPLSEVLEQAIKRTQTAVFEGDDHARNGTYSSGYNISMHDNARWNLVKLNQLLVDIRLTQEEIDTALALTRDMLHFTQTFEGGWFEGGWNKVRLELNYLLARTLARRAGQSQSIEDKQRAIAALQQVTRDPGFSQIATWQDIRGEEFASLANEAQYQALIAGR